MFFEVPYVPGLVFEESLAMEVDLPSLCEELLLLCCVLLEFLESTRWCFRSLAGDGIAPLSWLSFFLICRAFWSCWTSVFICGGLLGLCS